MNIGGPELIILLFIPFFVVSLVLWIWTLVDCINKEPAEGNERLIWVIVIALTGAIGAIIYLLVRRPQRLALHGK